MSDITPDQVARWKALCAEEAEILRRKSDLTEPFDRADSRRLDELHSAIADFAPLILAAYERVVAELATARFDHGRIRGDYDRELTRMTERLALEQTASTRTIAYLVTRKDALEVQVLELEEERDALRNEAADLKTKLKYVMDCADAAAGIPLKAEETPR